MYKCVPITLVTGYLGSGKTTLINNILKNEQGYKIAVIVNDIGEVNIDADLIQKGGVVSLGDDSLVALQNGCICCTLNQDLIKQILDLVKSQKFDHILIEASGICEPLPIVQSIIAIEDECKSRNMPMLCKLDAVICVTDALRLVKEFSCGDSLTSDSYDEEDIESLIIQQLEFCDMVLLNKVDEVSSEELNKVKRVIKQLQPVAKIIETNYSNVEMSTILDTNMFNFDHVAGSAGWVKQLEGENKDNRDEHINAKHDKHHDEHDEHEHHHHEHHDHEHGEHHHDEDEECHCEGECHCGHHHHHEGGEVEEYGIGTFVYFRRTPFNRQKFLEFISEDWKRQIIRTKGLVYFDDQPDMSYLFEQAGPQKNISEAGFWYATMPKDELNALLEQEPLLRKDWDEQYGDRMIKLVFIGQHIDKQSIIDRLDNM